MITDQFCIFSDNVAVKANATSTAVSVMPFIGKGEPITVSVAVTEAYSAAGTLAIAIQESKDGSTFTTLQSIDVPKAKLGKVGVFSFVLPSSLRGKSVRLSYTVGGSPTTGKLWAGITRDSFEGMEAGQYINAGKVVA